MMRIVRFMVIGIGGFVLGLLLVFGYRNSRRLAAAPPPVAAAAASLEAELDGAGPDPQFVYQVELGKAPTRGDDDALVTIVAFSSYDCSPCRQVEANLRMLADSDPTLIRLAWKSLPVDDDARRAARVALAAAPQDKFWQLHDRLTAREGRLDEASVLAEAKAVGIDMEALRAALAEPALDERLKLDEAQAARFGLKRGPAVFVNGKIVTTPTYEGVAKKIVEAGAYAQMLVESGIPAGSVYSRLMRGALTRSGPVSEMPDPQDLVESLK